MIGSLELSGQISIQAGINASSWEASVDGISLETDTKPGFHVGINYLSQVGEKFYFKPGIHYSQKGAKFFEFQTSQDYLEIPLAFTYQSNPEKGFYGEGGLYLGFLLSASDYSGDDVKDDYNTTDAGILLGGGYDFGKILIGIRGALGLTNLSKNDGTASEGKITNSNGQLYFAVKL